MSDDFRSPSHRGSKCDTTTCKSCILYQKKIEEEREAWLKAHLSKLAAMSDEEKKKLQEEKSKRLEESRLASERMKAEMKEKAEARRRISASRRRKIEHLCACGQQYAHLKGRKRYSKSILIWLDSLPEPELNGQ